MTKDLNATPAAVGASVALYKDTLIHQLSNLT